MPSGQGKLTNEAYLTWGRVSRSGAAASLCQLSAISVALEADIFTIWGSHLPQGCQSRVRSTGREPSENWLLWRYDDGFKALKD